MLAELLPSESTSPSSISEALFFFLFLSLISRTLSSRFFLNFSTLDSSSESVKDRDVSDRDLERDLDLDLESELYRSSSRKHEMKYGYLKLRVTTYFEVCTCKKNSSNDRGTLLTKARGKSLLESWGTNFLPNR